MSELQERLRRQRQHVDEDGLHFESAPQRPPGVDCTADAKLGGTPVAALSTPRGLPKLPAGGTLDFADAMSRRRARVDNDGATFESEPTPQTADFVAELHEGDGRPCLSERPARASPVHRGGPWTPKPSVEAREQADDRGEAALPEPPVLELPTRGAGAPEPAAPEASEQQAAGVAQAEPEGAPQAEASSGAREVAPEAGTAQGPADATEAAPPPSAAEGEPEEDDDDEEDEEHGDAEAQNSEEMGGPASEFQQEIRKEKDRICWLIRFGSGPLLDSYESPPFAIARYGDVCLKLHPKGTDGLAGCVLQLHAPGPRPRGIQVALFAAKGWKKLHLKSWPDGEDMVERFPLDVSKKPQLLCGCVFKLG